MSLHITNHHQTTAKYIQSFSFIMLGITIITALILSRIIPDTSAVSDSATATVTVTTACTMSSGGGSYSRTVDGGSTTNIDANPIVISCNDLGGSKIYAVGYSNDTLGTTDMIASIGSSYNIKTDATSGNSYWKMKVVNSANATVNATIPTSFTSYTTIPSDYALVATYNAVAGGSSIGSITPSYQVYMNSSQAAGTYTGKVKYTLVHPSSNSSLDKIVTISNSNTTSGADSIAISYGGSATVTVTPDTGYYLSSVSCPSGYTCTGYNTGESYTSQQTVTVTNNNTAVGGTLAFTGTKPCLHAISGTMQTFNPDDLCSGVTSGTLTDARDTQPYTVAKLADGKWWMTKNLNLAGGTVLSSDKSDVPSTNYYTLPASTAISDGTSVPSDQFSSYTTAYVFNTSNNTTTCNSSTPCNSYYSWLAATAGGKDGNGNAVTSKGYNAAYSICPKGWRLPTSTTSNASATASNRWKTGDWYALATAYGAKLESTYSDNSPTTGKNFYNNAGPGTTPNFLLAGYYYSGSFSDGGSSGSYWSATSYSSTYAYILYFRSSGVSSADNDLRGYGFSVRCVFGS